MRRTEPEEAWAVYEILAGKQAGIKVMCSQSQWEEMALKTPLAYALVQGRILCESEAEKLARGTSGDVKPAKARQSAVSAPVNPPHADPSTP